MQDAISKCFSNQVFVSLMNNGESYSCNFNVIITSKGTLVVAFEYWPGTVSYTGNYLLTPLSLTWPT